MLIAEEFLLLCLDNSSGKKALGSESLNPALGGALLVELALLERISITPHEAGWTKRGRVMITSSKPTDDPELDRVLDHVAADEGVKVYDMSGKRITKGLVDRLIARLIKCGTLREQRSAVLGIRSWPTDNPVPEEEVRRRLQQALVGGVAPTESTVALIALLDATGRLTKVIHTEDKLALRRRAKELSEGDWAAAAVKNAIAKMTAVYVAVSAGGGAASSG